MQFGVPNTEWIYSLWETKIFKKTKLLVFSIIVYSNCCVVHLLYLSDVAFPTCCNFDLRYLRIVVCSMRCACDSLHAHLRCTSFLLIVFSSRCTFGSLNLCASRQIHIMKKRQLPSLPRIPKTTVRQFSESKVQRINDNEYKYNKWKYNESNMQRIETTAIQIYD